MPRFYKTERAVRTASSEQVRRPIYRDATDEWRAYEPYLDPLKDALGPVLTPIRTHPRPERNGHGIIVSTRPRAVDNRATPLSQCCHTAEWGHSLLIASFVR